MTMPTGLTADIYNGKDTSLRAFVLNCAGQTEPGYIATDRGACSLPMDKAPALKPDGLLQKKVEHNEERLAYWLGVKEDPQEAQRLYDEQRTKHRQEDAERRTRMQGIRVRYCTMIARVERWQVPAQYDGLKDMMLDQLRMSLEYDYRPDGPLYADQVETVGEWVENWIGLYRRNIEYYKERLAKEKQRYDEANAYLQGLYDLLDEVEPYKTDEL